MTIAQVNFRVPYLAISYVTMTILNADYVIGSFITDTVAFVKNVVQRNAHKDH